MNVPNNYRITDEDNSRGYKLFVRQFGIGDGPEPTDDELYLADILIDAGYMQHATGKWPTVGEVLSKREKDAADRERKRLR
jgi:arylsulfatase A-like enzyme